MPFTTSTASHPGSAPPALRGRAGDAMRGYSHPGLYYAIVGSLVILPAVIYAISPDFYLRYVLSQQLREYQAVEMLTFVAGLAGGVLLCIAGVRLWKSKPSWDDVPGGIHAYSHRYYTWLVVASAGLAALFFAGEEVNWGQTFLHWNTPELEQDRNVTLNLHNTTQGFSIQSLGSVYIHFVFVVWPIGWALNRLFKFPAHWRPAVPIGPAIAAVACGLALSLTKDAYVGLVPDAKSTGFYVNYMEQIKEQKEMLFAIGFLLMGIGVLGRTQGDAS